MFRRFDKGSIYIKVLLFLGLVLLFFSLGRLYEQKTPFHPVEILKKREVKAKRISRKVERPPIEAAIVFNESEKEEENENDQEDVSLLSVCRQTWQEIAGLDLLDFEQSLLSQNQILSADCVKRMEEELDFSLVKNFLNLCHKNLSDRTYNEIESDCLPQAMGFRSYVIRQLYQDRKDLEEMDISSLSNQLYGGLLSIEEADREQVERNIDLANAMIAKNPNIYDAYKAKLINMLLLESKFGDEVDLQVYNEIYDEMIQFEGISAEEEILLEVEQLEMTEADVDTDSTDSLELRGFDSDMIHMPFLRLAALGKNEDLYNMSDDYIEVYPDSTIGYLYKAEALWRDGEEAEAFLILKEGLGKNNSEEALLRIFSKIQNDPLDRLYQMLP